MICVILSFYTFVSLLISSFAYAAYFEHGSRVNYERNDHLSQYASSKPTTKPDHARLIYSLNARGRLEKSFKASCVNGLNANGQTCTFSMVTRVATTSIDGVTVTIHVNGITAQSESFSVPDPTVEYNFNFEVHPNDSIQVFFSPKSPTDSYSYHVYNGGNPTGIVSISTPLSGVSIFSSTATTFELLNTCTGLNACPLHIFGTHGGSTDWAKSGVTVNIHVNDVLKGTFDGTTLDANIFAGDTIVYQVIGTTIPYGLQMTSNLVVDSVTFSSHWNSNSNFSPAIIPNDCTDFKSPFGGSVVKLTSDQVNHVLPSVTDNEDHSLEL